MKGVWIFLFTLFLLPGIQAQEVISFTLVNANTNTDIQDISDGDELNLNELPPKLNIRANTDPIEVGSVRFDYEGNANYRTENVFPYALRGDNNGNYAKLKLTVGEKTLTATPFAQSNAGGIPGTSFTINFTVISGGGSSDISVTGFELIDAQSDEVVATMNDGDLLNIDEIPDQINIRAITDPNIVGSVRFSFNGNPNFRTENVFPYALAGDNNGNYHVLDIGPGNYTLTATPFPGVKASGAPGASRTITFTISQDTIELPVAPSGLFAEVQGEETVELNWTDNSDNEDVFEVERNLGSGFELLAILDANLTTYTDQDLNPGQNATYRVRASNNNGASAYSNSVAVQTELDILPPTNLTAVALSNTSIQADFDAPDQGDGFVLQYAQNPGFQNATTLSLLFNQSSVVIDGVTPATTYYLRVQTLRLGGVSEWSNTAEVTTNQDLAAPTELTAEALSTTEIAVNFTGAAVGDQYELQYDLSDQFVSPTLISIPFGEESVFLSALEPSTMYFIRIRTVLDGSESPFSELVSAMTLDETVVNPPSGLTAVGISTSEIEVSFSAPENGDEFELEYAENSDFSSSQTLLIPFTQNQAVIGNLNEGTTYFFRIRTVLSGEVSAYSEEISGATLSPEPEGIAVTSFSLINANTDQVISDLEDGAIIQLNPGDALSIRANTNPAEVGSVVFDLNGQNVQIENVPPYALAGDSNGDYDTFPFMEGDYNLSASPFSGSNGSGTQGISLAISFIINEPEEPEIPLAPEDLFASDLGNGSVLLTFTNAPEGDFYELERSDDLSFSEVVNEIVTFGAGSYLVEGLQDDTYFFRMKTSLNGLVSEYSNIAAITIGENSGGVVVFDSEYKTWHPVTMSLVNGPFHNETDNNPNPWKDYRLDVIFTHDESGETFLVPGYFAVDGNASESSAQAGSIWRCHFTPNQTGVWNYTISFIQGTNVALDQNVPSGTAILPYNGQTGEFTIDPTDKTGRDFRAKGRLSYVDKHHLQFEGNGEYFLKGGPDAPENFLAYDDFDNTPNVGGRRKSWAPHEGDWNEGDPSWKDGKGTEIIGALNYLAEEEMNAFSFLTMNINGDDRNVYPYVSSSDRTHFDMSKLDQWDIVLAHGQTKGLYLHFKTQETENDQLLDGGDLGTQRKLYYRMLIARFGYHLALNWNLGEENTNTTAQRIAFSDYIRAIDPYDHHIVVHTFPGSQSSVYTPLLGTETLTGVSIQTGWNNVYSSTKQWVQASASTSQPWVCANDEQGGANVGVPPDDGYVDWQTGQVYNASGTDQDDIRRGTLWGNLMAGGAGVEYYFGYQRPQSDLTCQDFRSRDLMWDYTRYALNFFKENTPFQDLIIDNQSEVNFWVLTNEEGLFVAYLRNGGSESINVGSGNFIVRYFNPRTGEFFDEGISLTGPNISLQGPIESDQDWAVLIEPGSGNISLESKVNTRVNSSKIYPNPARDVFFVDSRNTTRVEIWSGEGRLLRTEVGNTKQIRVGDMQSGIYIVQIHSPSGIESHKLIKQ